MNKKKILNYRYIPIVIGTYLQYNYKNVGLPITIQGGLKL